MLIRAGGSGYRSIARPRRAINCPHAGYFFNPENEKRLEPRRHYC